MSTPSVSCVIPAFDAEHYLAAAIESVIAQTRPPLEVLVVDNGSGDRTSAVAAGFGTPVRVITLSRNAGPPAARNAGVAAARGELVAFLDADDIWLPEKLELQVEHLSTGLDASFAESENFWEPGLEDEEARWRELGRVRPLYSLGTLVATRALLERLPFAEALWHGDHADWVDRAREAGVRIGALPRVLLRRRRHAGNLTRTDPDAFEPYFTMLKARLDRARAEG